ncbi:hypothetical protein SLE2022_082700 [Rubroshorea leprosula]
MAEFNRRKGDWANLPTDIMGKIIERLCWVDRIRLFAVCKSWAVLRCLVLETPDFPWMLKFRGRGTLFELLDPLAKKGYVCDGWIEEKEKRIFANASIRCSRFGWVLLRSRASDSSDPRSYFVSTFLFSPVTGDLIKLPKLEEDFYLTNVATFSLNSTSPECMVFIFWRTCYSTGFSVCHLGDMTWKTSKLEDDRYRSYDLCPLDATYVAGSFYCLFSDGEVGAFDTALQQWKLLEQCGTKLKFSFRCKPPKFLISDANLLLREYDNDLVRLLWRYDFSEKCWAGENSAGSDENIFISPGLAVEDAIELVDTCFQTFDGKSFKVAPGGMFAEFYEWLPNDNESEEIQKIWFDQRFVWRKRDLL